MAAAAEERVLVGVVAGAHGVRGQVRIHSFTAAPADVAAYGPLFDETTTRRLQLTVTGATKDGVIARIRGVADRDAASALRGLRLYVPRSALPPTAADEFYHADLIGLAVELADGTGIGRVVAVQNYGAGDVLEIAPSEDGRTFDLPFTRLTVPVVDLAGRRLVVEPPAGLLGEPVAEAASSRSQAGRRRAR